MGSTSGRKWAPFLVLAVVGLFSLHCAADAAPNAVVTKDAALEKDAEWLSFDFSGQKYPVLYNQEHIAIEGEVLSLDHFLPVFSPEQRSPKVHDGFLSERQAANAPQRPDTVVL